MDTDKFISYFKYEPDGKVDSYHLINEPPYAGDCEDFARTVAHIESGGALQDFIDLWLFKNQYHFVVTDSGIKHVVLYRRGMGYIDNIMPYWRNTIDFKRKFPYIILPPIVMFKQIIGKFIE